MEWGPEPLPSALRLLSGHQLVLEPLPHSRDRQRRGLLGPRVGPLASLPASGCAAARGVLAWSAPWRWMSSGAVSAVPPGPQAAEDVGPGLPEDPSPELAAGARGQPQPHPVDSAVLPWGLLLVLCAPSPAASVCPEESGVLSAPSRGSRASLTPVRGPQGPSHRITSVFPSAGPVFHEEPSGLL